MECEGLESKHAYDVVFNRVKLLSHECFNLWYNIMDMSTMEVGVVHHIGDHFVVSSLANSLSCLNERAEPCPVVFVEDSDLKGKMFKRSLPITHKQVVLCLNFVGPVGDYLRVVDQDEIVVDTVCSAFCLISSDINVLNGSCGSHNLVFLYNFLAIDGFVLWLCCDGNCR